MKKKPLTYYFLHLSQFAYLHVQMKIIYCRIWSKQESKIPQSQR